MEYNLKKNLRTLFNEVEFLYFVLERIISFK